MQDIKFDAEAIAKDLIAGHTRGQLHKEMIQSIEKPLLKVLIEDNRYNVSEVARILGITKNTTRTKLRKYFGQKYCN